MVNEIIHGDCLDVMNDIPAGSVDMILCDLPYGTTVCAWDTIIPLESLWSHYERIIKDNGAIVLTGSQPFTTVLINSNIKLFKYEWIWEKSNGTNFMQAKHQPFKVHENILVFSKMAASYSKLGSMNYNPQFTDGEPYEIISGKKDHKNHVFYRKNNSRALEGYETKNEGKRYPRSVMKFIEERGLHPTQKPVSLFEYLIRTYTNEGDTVLDNCVGSGTTAVAALSCGRNFIAIEKELKYVKIARERIDRVQTAMNF